ncbi:MAG: hypothetical protein RIT45_377 [Pseudomonadota bacterium]|jgi:hypothetical protein
MIGKSASVLAANAGSVAGSFVIWSVSSLFVDA